MSNSDLVLKQMSRSNERGHISEVKRNLSLAEYQIAQAESGIAKIQKAYESNSPLYTAEEAARRIAEYRDRILKVTRRKEEPENSLQRINQRYRILKANKRSTSKTSVRKCP